MYCSSFSSFTKIGNMAEYPGRDARRELGPNTWSTGRRVAVRIYTTDRDTQQARPELEQTYKGLSVPRGRNIAVVKRYFLRL